MENNLRYKMYGLVTYQLCGTIHAGIQFGHAVVEYGQWANNWGGEFLKVYNKWANNDKTFIILNGGTTNTNRSSYGTLNQTLDLFTKNDIIAMPFYEPDLGDQLTAFVFLVDERVWDKIKYPDFVSDRTFKSPSPNYKYKQWSAKIGGPKNVFLRKQLANFKLA